MSSTNAETAAAGGLASTLPSSGFRRVRWLLIVLVVLVGGGSALAAWRQGADAADQEDVTVAQEVVDQVERTVDIAQAGMAGAGGIVPATGPVNVMVFESFAAEVLRSSPLQALAFEPVVPTAARFAFEIELGRPIIDRGPDGATPAPARPFHYPVLSVVPVLESNRALLGFDLVGDRVRFTAAEQARDTGQVVFSEPTPSQPTGTTSFFVIKALYRPGAAVSTVAERRNTLVGFVSSAYTSTLFAEALEAALPDDTAVELRDGSTLLADTGDAEGGIRRLAKAGNRQWTILVDGPASADHGVAVALAALTLVIAGGLAYLFRRGSQHDQEVRRTAALIGRTADLAQALAAAETVGEVEHVVFTHVPAVVEARVAGLAFVDREDGSIVVRHPEPVEEDMGRRYDRVALDAELPLAEVVRTGQMLVLPDLAAWREHTPAAVVADVERVGLVGAVVLPVESSSGRIMATLSIAWPRRIHLDDASLATVSTITEICQYALQRAMATDDAARRAGELALLAEHLASSITTDAVGEVATSFGRAPVEAAGTSVGLIEGDRLVLHHGDTVPEHYRTGVTEVALDEGLAVTEVARTGTMLLFETQDAYERQFPDAGGPLVGGRAILPLKRADGRPIGVIAHLWNGPREFDDALVSTLTTIAELTGQAVERARLAQLQAEDARRTEALAHLAQGLASRTNSEAVMAFLSRGVLAPLDAFHAAVAVIEGTSLRRHFTPGELTEHGLGPLPVLTSLDADTPLAHAARTGESVLLADEAQMRAAYPHMAQAWVDIGYGAYIIVPLRDRHGGMIGALGIGWDHPVTIDADLRDRISTVAGIAGQTLERSQLVDRLRADAQRSESLAELAEVLATARSADEVAEAVVTQAANVVAGSGADIAILDQTTGRLHVHQPTDAGDAELARIVGLEDAADGPHVDVMRDGGILTFPDRASYVAAYPHLEQAVVELGYEAAACIELRDTVGQRLGAVGFGWADPVEFDEAVLASLHGVADLCSQALERAQLSDAEHRLVTTLQASVLAPLPDAEGLSCAARYLPAARSVGMGGDWYEGMVLSDGRYAVVLGDVAGHGITAVGQMAQFRSVIGALIRLDTPIEDLFSLATSVVQHDSPIATAVVVVVDVASGRLHYVAAGHPPPLLRLPGGEVVLLNEGRQPLLGIPSTRHVPGEHPFPEGSTLLCYTDGLVERRGETIEVSIDRLRSVLEAATAPDAETLADDLLATLVPKRTQADDVALAVITRPPDG